jgi:hypothetical protein
MELIIEPSNGLANVVCAAVSGGTDVDKVEVDVEGESETGSGGVTVEEDEADMRGGSET